MDDIEKFLAAAVELERDAAQRYDELADAISGLGQDEVVAFFRQQAIYSRRHLQQAKARTGFREPWSREEEASTGGDKTPEAPERIFEPGSSPEAAAIWAADGNLSLDQAMQVALDAEEAARSYYEGEATSSHDPEVRQMAAEFEQEEAGHVRALKELMAKVLGVS